MLQALWEGDADIAVLTESHLRDEDIFEYLEDGVTKNIKLNVSPYRVVNWHNRENMEMQRSGGVLIIARMGIDFTNVPQTRLPVEPLSCCSVRVHAIDGVGSPFRLTGLYIPPPPTAKMNAQFLESLTCDDELDFYGEERLNHIICGDFNPPSWSEMYDISMAESGLFDLSDPSVPTFPSGNSLDRFKARTPCF